MNCRETEPLLSAYLDGELDAAHVLGIDAHARECPACAARLESGKQLSAAVRAAPYYRAAPSLRARIESPAAPAWRRPAAWAALAATVALAILVIGRADRTGNEIVQAHLRSLRAGHLVDIAASSRRAVHPWFAGRLDYSLDVEDISGRGFAFSGARLDSLNGRTVAVLVYQRGPHVINVFVWPAGQEADRHPVAAVIGGLNLVNWRAEGMNWWAISDLPLAELEQLPLCPCVLPVHETLRG